MSKIPSSKNTPKFATKMHLELDNLEELLLYTFTIFGRKLVDEEQAYIQIDRVRVEIPEAIAKAEEILDYEEKIVIEAEQRAQQIILKAQEQAQILLDESKILRQVEIEANQIRTQNLQECEALRSQVLNEVNQIRQKFKQEQEQMRKQEIIDLQNLRQEVTEYSDHTLADLEKRLLETTKIVQSGRKFMQQEAKKLK